MDLNFNVYLKQSNLKLIRRKKTFNSKNKFQHKFNLLSNSGNCTTMSGEPTEQDLLQAVKESLAQDGRLGRFKAELRSAVMSILNRDPGNTTSATTQMPEETHMINELIREYLVWNGYLYAEQILAAESGKNSEKPNRESLAAKLGVMDDVKTSKIPLLYFIVSNFKNSE